MNEHPSPDRPAAELLVIGSVNEDRFTFVERFPLPGETVTALAGRRGLGGKGANQAVAAARAGVRVALVAKTGTDAPHRHARAGGAGRDRARGGAAPPVLDPRAGLTG